MMRKLQILYVQKACYYTFFLSVSKQERFTTDSDDFISVTGIRSTQNTEDIHTTPEKVQLIQDTTGNGIYLK